MDPSLVHSVILQTMRYALLALLLCALESRAQPFPIGERSVTFLDQARNRNIATSIRYPALSSGTNAAFADGEFPVLVVGHGFLMTTDAYSNLWEHFVPLGYIVALPTTEGGIVPNHAEFGADLAFLASALQAADTEVGSPFFGHVAPTTALMGHSMGGGASFLGAAGNADITTLVNLAAAETNPSAVSAATDVLVPTLMFAGSNDCVTPIPDHTAPMYAALTVPCRAFVNITGGGHCYFAESNFNCSFGELTCSPSPAITRAQQHDVVNDFATLWLDHFLKGDEAALSAFLDSMAVTDRAVCETTCAFSTSIREPRLAFPMLVPSPADGFVRLLGAEGRTLLRFHDSQGRLCREQWVVGEEPVDISALPTGAYAVALLLDDARSFQRLVVSR